MNTFDLYEKIKPLIKNNFHNLCNLIRIEYKEIQHIKTTSINKNYMFNDTISAPFYQTIGITKENLKALISKYVKITNNYDSLDTNNILLLFIMRYALETKQETIFKLTYDIFLYKLYYPIFTTYFKYGIDESSFEYFKSTLSHKYELSKQDTIYDAVDEIGKRILIKYKQNISGKSEKDFLLLPVNSKTRLNQFVKEIMKAYSPFIEKNKIHLNASRDLEDEEGAVFNDQSTNNNKNINEYKNRLQLALLYNELPEVILKTLSHQFKKINIMDIEFIYNNIIKNKEHQNSLIDLFVECLDHRYDINNLKIIQKLLDESNKHKENDDIKRLDNILFLEKPELKESQKITLIEYRKSVIYILFLFLRRSKN